MHEIDAPAIDDILKGHINAINLKYLTIFIILNILFAFVNWLIQRNVKLIDAKLIRTKAREEKRIEVTEHIYKELVSFTYLLTADELSKSTNRLSLLEKYLTDQGLYISNSLKIEVLRFNDYLKIVMTDFTRKNFNLERDILNNINYEFNK